MTKAVLCSNSLFNLSGSREVPPRQATEKELLLFHTPEYLKALRRVEMGIFRADDLAWNLGTPETPVFPGLFSYAELAAGATLSGEMIVHGNADFVFNPSGGFHHAFPAAAGGFSYINDVVLGCKVLNAFGEARTQSQPRCPPRQRHASRLLRFARRFYNFVPRKRENAFPLERIRE